MSNEIRGKLTALRRELKSANKDRKKAIQQEIVALELASRPQTAQADQEPEATGANEQNEQKLRAREKKRGKEAAVLKAREQTLADARERVLSGPRLDTKEAEALAQILAKASPPLEVHGIAPDGNCLFAALAHQLALHNRHYTQKDLRTLAAEWICAHPEDYTGFIDFQDPECTDLDGYCAQVERSGWWGGELELGALASALSSEIVVYTSDGPKTFTPQGAVRNTLRVSFHRFEYGLGAHYNSLLPT